VEHNKALSGPPVGGGIGVVLGGALGCLMGLGILAILGAGPLVAAGPTIAALVGAGAGAIAGGIIGSFMGVRMPKFEAIQYKGKMDGGNILMSVLTGDAAARDRVKAIFNNAGSVTAAGSGRRSRLRQAVRGRRSCHEPQLRLTQRGGSVAHSGTRATNKPRTVPVYRMLASYRETVSRVLRDQRRV
jgi:hypothetical protein